VRVRPDGARDDVPLGAEDGEEGSGAPRKKQRRCGRCGKAGYNARTCAMRVEEAAESEKEGSGEVECE